MEVSSHLRYVKEHETQISAFILMDWMFFTALPDGSHNFHEDSVYFNLPSLTIPNKSVYGISCYRQIAVENLKVRPGPDVTRSTVQKSVCILASQPIYGKLCESTPVTLDFIDFFLYQCFRLR